MYIHVICIDKQLIINSCLPHAGECYIHIHVSQLEYFPVNNQVFPKKVSTNIVLLLAIIFVMAHINKEALNLLNFLNGIIHLPFFELNIIIVRDIKFWTWSWSANSIEPGQTAQMYRLAWLYNGSNGLSLSVPAG